MGTESAELCRAEQTARILVVDDETDIAELVADSLKYADPSWYVVAESDPALAAQRLRDEAFDCLITDLVMPGVDGLHLARQARDRQGEITLIGITGRGTFESGLEALRLGFADIIQKPFDVRDVQRAVRRTLRSHHDEGTDEGGLAELQQAKAALEASHAQLAQKLDIASHDLVLSSKRMARQLDELALVSGAAKTLLGIVDLEDLLSLCAELVGDQVTADTSVIGLFEPQEGAIGILARAHPSGDEPASLCWLRKPIQAGVMCRAIQTQKTIHVEDVASSVLLDVQEKHLWPAGRLLVVPIPYQDSAAGAAVLHRPPGSDDFRAFDVQRLTKLVEVMGPPIACARTQHVQRCRIYSTLEAMVDAVEGRDPYLRGHSARVLAYCQPLAQALEFTQPQMGAIQIAARLHDLGRMVIPEAVTNHPGPLTEDQWEIVHQHPDAGASLLRNLSFLGNVADIIRAHHESYDGTGYPDLKAGEEIPLIARVIAVADAFEAMTSSRPHRQALSIEDALAQLRKLSGEQFDPRVVEAFVAIPTATLQDVHASYR
jgi:response regulator RpfG family c-di-GMP phosphodiesterase